MALERVKRCTHNFVTRDLSLSVLSKDRSHRVDSDDESVISRLPSLLVGSGLSLLHSSGDTHCRKGNDKEAETRSVSRRFESEKEGRKRTDGSSSSSSSEEDVDGLARKSRGLDGVVDFGPSGEVVSERVLRVCVLVQDHGVGDSGAKTFCDPGRRASEESSFRGQRSHFCETEMEKRGLDSLDVRSNLVPCLLVGSSDDLGSHRPEGSLLLERHLRKKKGTKVSTDRSR